MYGLLIAVASLVVEHGLQGTQASVVVATSLVAPWHVGSSGTSDQSVSPALAGEFLTTGPPVLSLSVCLTLCDPFDCSQPGSSVHGIFQARIRTTREVLKLFLMNHFYPVDFSQEKCSRALFP